MISGLVLKYLNGAHFVTRRGYKAACPVSSSFCLTVPMQTLMESPSRGHRHARILLSWSRKAGRTGSGGRTLISARRANPLAPSNRQYGHVRARLYPHVPANEVPVCSRLTTTTASLASQLGSTGFLSAWRSPRERRYQLHLPDSPVQTSFHFSSRTPPHRLPLLTLAGWQRTNLSLLGCNVDQ